MKLKSWNTTKAKKTKLGRMLCRCLGDERGAVMMEYVILAVLIAAACVAAVVMFGKSIVGMFDTAATTATRGSSEGLAVKATMEKTQKDGAAAAAKAANTFHNTNETESKQ